MKLKPEDHEYTASVACSLIPERVSKDIMLRYATVAFYILMVVVLVSFYRSHDHYLAVTVAILSVAVFEGSMRRRMKPRGTRR
jgi:hypothetical protein